MPLQRIILDQPEELEVGQKRLGVTEDALMALASRGLIPAGPPANQFKGAMPEQITSLDDEKLGDLLNNLSRWCGFIDEELSKAESTMKSAKAQLEFIEARIRIAIRSDMADKKLTVQDKNDVVITDPRIVSAKAQVLYTAAVYDLTRTLLNTAQRDWDTVSRRITQRGQGIERMKRETNVAVVPSGGRSFNRPQH